MHVELPLFLMGLGMGSSMMPAMSAALASIERSSVARVTAGLNLLQRVGGSIGTALLAVVLSHELAAVTVDANGASVTPVARNIAAIAQA